MLVGSTCWQRKNISLQLSGLVLKVHKSACTIEIQHEQSRFKLNAVFIDELVYGNDQSKRYPYINI